MLAQNFKTPADLGITDAEFAALVKVLGMLERGELQPADKDRYGTYGVPTGDNGFDMSRVLVQSDCGTVGCLMGWCKVVTGQEDIFDRYELADICRQSVKLGELFMFGDTRRFQVIQPAQAAIALRNYLTHGEPCWSEALA